MPVIIMINTEKAQSADYIVDIGEQHHKAGRLREAEVSYSNALKIDPGHPGALYYLANIAYEDGRFQFSIRLIEELLRGEPNDAEAWHLLGQVALKERKFSRSIECFQKSVSIEPNYVLAYYGLGIALNQQDEVEDALANLQQAATLDPTFVDTYRVMGNIFCAQKKFDEAVRSYQKAIAVKSDFKLAYEGVGSILLAQEKWADAIVIYRKAVAEGAGSAMIYVGLGIANSHLDDNKNAISNFEQAITLDSFCFLAHFHLANVFHKQRLFSKAVSSYEQAAAINPHDKYLLKKLASTLLYNMRDYHKAASVYKQLLELDPNDPVARHHFLACSGEAIPSRADNAYIENTFDAFAETFDNVLVEQTKYCGPQLIAQALQRECEARKQYEILDAGCGTGLCGPLVVEYAAKLTGVDLSAGMLTKARPRNVYDELIKAELTAYLQSQLNAFDIILSADTFIYFGALEALVSAARTALRNYGYLFFTVESFTSDCSVNETERGYCLYPHGRYGHSEAYLRHILNKVGFTIIKMEANFLRYENSRSVQAFVVTCRKMPN